MPLLLRSFNLLWWDKYIVDDLDDPIRGDAIFDYDGGETINLNANEPTVAPNINAERAVFEQCRQINLIPESVTRSVRKRLNYAYMEIAFRNTGLFSVVSLVVGIRVESLVGHNVILQQGLQILLSVTAEQEAVDSWTKLLEGEIRRCKHGATNVVGSIVHRRNQVGLGQRKFEGAELAGKETDNVNNLGGRHQNAVDSVYDAVGPKLTSVSFTVTQAHKT